MESLTRAQQELYDWLVEYIETTQHAPSIRQMMRAMNLRSPAPIQSRLERLKTKGYIDWTEGKARTLRILHPKPKGVSITGYVTPGGLLELTNESNEKLDLGAVLKQQNAYALRVTGDGLANDHIIEGDLIVLRPPLPDDEPPNGKIVVVKVEGYGVSIKTYLHDGEKIILRSSNPKYQPIEATPDQIEIQGVLVGVWRNG
ncbi:MAG: transcriptional repressor LexA [Microcystaceae cyanobacterium]